MIDYCTILFDERERDLFPLHINSLRHHMPGVFNIKVSVRPEDTGAIELCEKFGVEALLHPAYTQSPGKKLDQCGARPGFDVANRHDLLMKACTSDWVVLSHMDIVWTSDMISKIKPYMTDEYGVLGHHPGGCLAVNRKAYGECHAGFWNYSFKGDYYDDPRGAWIRLAGALQPPDPGGRSVSVATVDVGIMLEIEMQFYTYKVLRGAMHYMLEHIGGGSYHGRNGVADFSNEPMTEAGLASHKVVYDNVQAALAKFAMFKGEE
uniref:Glycosyltransferase n=1 Tax=viral metagenome TaxID=1070528 RepID=A0A6M3L5P4_9ZZZZ